MCFLFTAGCYVFASYEGWFAENEFVVISKNRWGPFGHRGPRAKAGTFSIDCVLLHLQACGSGLYLHNRAEIVDGTCTNRSGLMKLTRSSNDVLYSHSKIERADAVRCFPDRLAESYTAATRCGSECAW